METRKSFYNRLYDTQGLKSTRSTHILHIWIEFYANATDFDQILAFASRSDMEEYINYQIERWFGTDKVYTYYDHSSEFGAYYRIPCNGSDTPPMDFFPEEIRKQISAVCFQMSNTPICKY